MKGCSLHCIGVMLGAVATAFAAQPPAVGVSQDPAVRPGTAARLMAAAFEAPLRRCPLQRDAGISVLPPFTMERLARDEADAAWRATNHAHGFRIDFLADRVLMTADHAGTSSWRIGLELVGFGYEGCVREVGPASLEVVGRRASYRRAELEEWYLNDARGLEQGFTVAAPPEPDVAGRSTLVFRLALSGSSAHLSALGPAAIRFVSPDGDRVLDYGNLSAVDADGRVLRSWLVLAGSSLEIKVDIADARFPIVVDPLASSPNWTVTSEQGAAHLGIAVASAGDVNGDGYDDVIVGAPFYDDDCCDEGRVLLFYGAVGGLAGSAGWAFSGGQECAYCGYAVDGAGDVNGDGYDDVIIGSSQFESGAGGQGRVWVFHGGASGLEADPAWTVDGDQGGGCFGATVAGAGDVNGDGYDDVVVGAPDQDGEVADAGIACVFHGSAGGLQKNPAWCARGTQQRERCGIALAGAGDVNGDGYDDVVVGSPAHDGAETNGGRVCLYLGSATGLDEVAAWTMEGEQKAASFGSSVAGAGDVNNDGFADVVVGAHGFGEGAAEWGRAWLFHGSADGLSREAVWVADGKQQAGRFGRTVAAAGDVNADGYGDVVVGACGGGEGSGGGRAYIFFGSYDGLSPAAAWTSAGLQNDGGFGWSVAGAGDLDGDGHADVLVGAPLCDGEAIDEGRVAVFYGGEIDSATRTGWVVESDQDYARLGYSVAAAGDVDRDGFDDVVVGAPWYDEGADDSGRVYLFTGSACGLAVEPAWTARGPREGAGFGFSVSGAGDVNGDGFADVIVGAPCRDAAGERGGQAFVFAGGPEGLGSAPAWTLSGEDGDAGFGFAVAAAGDVNGDGYDDVVVAAPCLDQASGCLGRALVFLGGRQGLSGVAVKVLQGLRERDGFGLAVAGAGDVDGDGDTEVLVGAPFSGHAYLFAGDPAALGEVPLWTGRGESSGDCFGWALAHAGDVNADGFADVIIGAPALVEGHGGSGSAFIFLGHGGGLGEAPAWVARGEQEGMEFGRVVCRAGDVDGNGHEDVLVGAPGYDGTAVDEGRAFLFQGTQGGVGEVASWTGDGGQSGAGYSGSVAGAGDVNDDGFADYLIGAPSHHGGSVAEGRAYGFYGSSQER